MAPRVLDNLAWMPRPSVGDLVLWRFCMSAEIIKLSDRRKARPTTLPNLMGLPLSIFAAYADIGLAIYLSIIDAAQQGLKQ
jgi:hypothetical protein